MPGFLVSLKKKTHTKINTHKKNENNSHLLATLFDNEVSVADSKLFGFLELRQNSFSFTKRTQFTANYLFDVATLVSFKSRMSSLTEIRIFDAVGFAL